MLSGQFTVARNDEKLIIGSNLMLSNIGKGRHNLLLRPEVGCLFELKVANGARQGKVSVDATKVDEASSGLNSLLLWFVRGLVIERKGLCAPFDAEHASRITSICLVCVSAAAF